MMKTALVYDWLVTRGGGERALSAVHELFPSTIFTLVHDRQLDFGEVVTSGLQRIPGATKVFRNFLPFFPRAIEGFDLREYDVVLSCSHAVAKGALTHAEQLHVCYCFTPMRYAWDLYWEYLGGLKGVKRAIVKRVLHRLREWDVASCSRVDEFVAISEHVRRRIRKTYGRDAAVIYPPVRTEGVAVREAKEDFYLTASRMVPYKRIDLIVEAFAEMGDKKLVVVGDGPEMGRVKSKAKGNVEILGRVDDGVLKDLMGRAKGFVFAAEEDFGIVNVEAMAAGTPVIAFGKGGSLETVGKTGVFFGEQTVGSVVDAVRGFEKREFDPSVVRAQAELFSEERFKREFKQFVNRKWEAFCENRNFSRR